MEYSSTTPIAITVILVLVAALFVWLSLTLASCPGPPLKAPGPA